MIGLLAGGVGAVPRDGLIVGIRRIQAQLGGQFSTQTLVVVATGHLLVVLVVDLLDGADLNRLDQVVATRSWEFRADEVGATSTAVGPSRLRTWSRSGS